jgi:hypothetical protein
MAKISWLSAFQNMTYTMNELLVSDYLPSEENRSIKCVYCKAYKNKYFINLPANYVHGPFLILYCIVLWSFISHFMSNSKGGNLILAIHS